MSDLENPRVAAGALLELGADVGEQLVGNGALLHVPRHQPAVVQGAAAGARDELLDKWAELLCLRLGCLDRSMLEQGHRQAAHQGKLLLTRAAELTSRLGVTH